MGDPQALLRSVREHQPDAVLTDIRMPPTGTNEGIELLLNRISKTDNNTQFLATLTKSLDEASAGRRGGD